MAPGRQHLDLTPSSFVFSGTHPSLSRDRIGLWEERDANYDNRYDFHTLFYDCYYEPDDGEVILICPSLFNFSRLISEASFAIDGRAAAVKGVSGLSRGNAVRFDAPARVPEVFSFEHPLFRGEVPVSRVERDLFAGKNAVYAISKDNKLPWITDWMRYYVEEHGANAFVLYDNHSTDYSMEDLQEAMQSVPGVEATALVRAWFPFGPGGAGNTNFNSKFLHMTMVELGRRRLLGRARAVLNVDIDELVYSRSGQTIFDATVASEKGYVRMDGEWVYTDAPGGQGVDHADHRFIRPRGGPKVNRKYCVAPEGPLKGKPWLTHRIVSRKDPTDPGFGFWHFRRVSNSWDYSREEFDPQVMQEDPRLAGTMARVFPRSG
jgi:hypothetical protein